LESDKFIPEESLEEKGGYMANETKPNQLIESRKTLIGFLESSQFQEQVQKALPNYLTKERFVRIAITAATKNPSLFLCDKLSVAQAILICAQAGLEPDNQLAYLIPYNTKVGWQAQVIFGYRGLITLARRNGIESIYADSVCEKDVFDPRVEDGLKKITHRVNWKEDRGAPYAFYCVTVKEGAVDYEVMNLAEIKAIQSRSKAKDSGPWQTDFIEMAKKTVIRRMSKRWDISPEIRDAIYADDDTPEPIEVQAHSRPIFAAPKQMMGPDVAESTTTASGPLAPLGASDQYIPAEGEFTSEEAEKLVREEMGGGK